MPVQIPAPAPMARADMPAGSASGWQDLIRAGAALAGAGQSAQAEILLAQALAQCPQDSETWARIAAVYLRSGDPARALDLFNAAFALAPHHRESQYGRGLALHALGDTAAALKAFRRLTGLCPVHWTVWESIADITPDERERAVAISEAADALRRRCQQTSATPSHFLRCSQALIDAGRYRDSVRFVRKYCDRFPSPAAADSTLARALYNGGQFREAFRQMARALRCLRPQDFPAQPRPAGLDPRAAATAARELIDILTGLGVTVFLAAGTLLGFQRGGEPLAHDRDIDLGVLQHPDGSPDIAALLRGHPDLMLPRAARPGDRYFGITFKGVAADIFIYQPCDNMLVCGLGNLPGDIQWRFSQFVIASKIYRSQPWPVPADPQRYLSETYGPDWRTPDTGFASAVSSPALWNTDPYARAYYAAARTLKACLAGDTLKAAALMHQSPIPFALPPTEGPPRRLIPPTDGSP